MLRDLRINKIPIFEREGWLCQPSLSKIGILFSCKSLRCFLGKNIPPSFPHMRESRKAEWLTDRLVMDAHFHGHDGALLLAGHSFLGTFFSRDRLTFSVVLLQCLEIQFGEGLEEGA